ncbi:ABC transporter permease [Rhodobacter sp. NTK016B]|uniref:ABC transporter permease n=1 Tax=Rhodobacter sp. NTK016B TaxID=2759676 RepID=UPI001A8EBEB7|nr:ABC transporter permease [Rhodobacter sp. NTK016B]MBN8290991.1 ABC transporter permease [Rhodobacter sp. NTK016B]
MRQLLLSRGIRAALTLFLCLVLAFVILRLSGDPMMALVPGEVPPVLLDEYRVRWGLDRPLPEQFLRYVLAAMRGDFGLSLIDGRPAIELVTERIGATLKLGLASLLLALVIGLPAGTYAALNRDKLGDRLVMSTAIFGYAMPNFFLGLLMILLFALQLRLLPSSGYGTPAHLVLPALTLGTALAAKLARFTRTSVLDVLGQPHVRTARGKRLSGFAVLIRHVLPNAAIPVITFLGFEIGLLIGGAVVTETVFGWPGIGQLLVMSVTRRDLAVVQAIVLMIALAIVVVNLLVDLSYGRIDPRVRGTHGKRV